MQSKEIRICPSVIACDFLSMGREVERLESAGADWLHLDVMDGHFVPNITFGPQMVSAINRKTDLFLDVHLMMYNPYDYIERFVEAGADLISFHIEATEDVFETIEYIKTCNVKAGLAISPETPIDMVTKYIPFCDLVLIMTVEPGFGGQAFIQESLDRIRYIRKICNAEKIALDIQVDGGINYDTAKASSEAGANIFVSGSFLIGQKDLLKAVHDLRTVCTEHFVLGQ